MELQVVEGDLARLPAGIGRDYDRVFANPPFHEANSAAPGEQRALAHHARSGLIADWVGAALRCLRPEGTLTFILRVERLPELLGALTGKAADVRLLPLWPKAGRPARRLVVQARKGARAAPVLLPGMVLHETDGRFTLAAEAVLRDAAALPLEA